MASNIVKDFVKKQTSPITIGVPKSKSQDESESRPKYVEPAAPVTNPQPKAVTTSQEQEFVAKGRGGRPKSDIEKVKLSIYVPSEVKSKLIRIQHDNYKQSLNDILLEAVLDLVKKYDR